MPAGGMEHEGRGISSHHTATAPPATGDGHTAPPPPAATDLRRHTPLSDTGGQSIGHSTPDPQQKTHADPKQHTLHTHTIHTDQSTPLAGKYSESAPLEGTTVDISTEEKKGDTHTEAETSETIAYSEYDTPRKGDTTPEEGAREACNILKQQPADMQMSTAHPHSAPTQETTGTTELQHTTLPMAQNLSESAPQQALQYRWPHLRKKKLKKADGNGKLRTADRAILGKLTSRHINP